MNRNMSSSWGAARWTAIGGQLDGGYGFVQQQTGASAPGRQVEGDEISRSSSAYRQGPGDIAAGALLDGAFDDYASRLQGCCWSQEQDASSIAGAARDQVTSRQLARFSAACWPGRKSKRLMPGEVGQVTEPVT